METDYLVIGAGASGMAFADTLLDEAPDAHITLVDRHAKPGGHWNDAYSFVGLHQPSAFYGVNSMELGSLRKDEDGPNKGMYELASGPEISAYYDKVMQQRMLPSGRVKFFPMSEYAGDGRIVSLLSGAVTQVGVRRKVVDATRFSPTVPSTHKRNFQVADGVRVVPPNELPQLWHTREGETPPRAFCIVGAGKTAMDAGVWLLRHGVPPSAIHWVMPRDSWVQNRQCVQPGAEFFFHTIGGEASRMAAWAQGTSIDDVFLRMEKTGQMLRIDPSRTPTMYHYAILSTGEVELLRSITQVIRMGRVESIEPGELVMQQGRAAMAPGTLYIDCTASALQFRKAEPVFQGDRITVQLLRAPLITLSAAVTAYVEVHGADDAQKNEMCKPVPLPRNLAGYAPATLVSMSNQMRWSQDAALRTWLRNSRLDGFGKLVADVGKDDAEKQEVLARLKTSAMAAVGNMQKLMAGG
ncbi:NAD(P)-binding protein [Ramlibacter albus]|uniref:NAD(P)/FAD-dependent oxidoreductase n=1 Tax=Ramlibacter albus TaxID=2079448 RepID=A0A923S3A0_9BURK|nr:FAD/NAD(P)-binding protein [Ramlibacter albus]MBC5765623.1 NAD(P)/FAD-dependent oxidoreductase [Ramlibacter albus]